MPISGADVAALVIMVLPGFLGYRYAVFRRPDQTDRGAIWQVSEILQYSAYVHLLGIWLAFGVNASLYAIGFDIGLTKLLSDGPAAFMVANPLPAALFLSAYFLYVIVASTLLGSANFPDKVQRWLVVGFGRIRLRGDAEYPQAPVWYRAFREIPEANRWGAPMVLIKMKNGDEYFGNIVSYALDPSDHQDKDFLLEHARYYKSGEAELILDKFDSVGSVLVNGNEVSSIQVFHEPYRARMGQAGDR